MVEGVVLGIGGAFYFLKGFDRGKKFPLIVGGLSLAIGTVLLITGAAALN
jgi:hypothetical protein